MVDYCAFGWILAAVLGLAIALSFFVSPRRNRRGGADSTPRSEGVISSSATNGECRSVDGDADVIIVGAGVAGSALAHTLGKVHRFYCFLLNFESVLYFCSLSLSLSLHFSPSCSRHHASNYSFWPLLLMKTGYLRAVYI